MIDLHVHTWRCRHAEGQPDEYVRTAAARAVNVLAFTEHLPLAPELAQRVPGAAEYAMPASELDDYIRDVAGAAALGATLGVEVLLGVEIDAVREGFDHARTLLSAHPFDFVLGSVHFIDDWAFDDPALVDRYDRWRLDELWERYFTDLIEAGRSGLADAMGHADLVKKLRGRPDTDVSHLYAQAAEAFAQAGVGAEVNTGGLRKPCAEIYPSLPFLKELKRAGVPCTIGSDAHRPSEVGSDSAAAIELLRAAGYSSVLVFRGRTAQEVGLSEL